MKIIIFIALIMSILVGNAYCEQEVLFSIKNIGLGGYGGPHYRLGFKKQGVLIFAGGPCCIIINRIFCLGFTGSSLDADYKYTEMGYGGLFTGFFLIPDAPFDITPGITIGGGGAHMVDITSQEEYSSGFFIIEPEAQILWRITSFLQLNCGICYRLILGLSSIPDIDDAELSGIGVLFQLRYGVF